MSDAGAPFSGGGHTCCFNQLNGTVSPLSQQMDTSMKSRRLDAQDSLASGPALCSLMHPSNIDNPDPSHPTTQERIWTLPTALTLARVAAIPAFVALWYSPAPWAPAAATWLLLAASVTDFLDGYLARKLVRGAGVGVGRACLCVAAWAPASGSCTRRRLLWEWHQLHGKVTLLPNRQPSTLPPKTHKQNVASEFGAFLDPVADKLMVSTALVLLSTAPIVAGRLAGDALLCPLAAAAIVGREIAMSALREWAAGAGPAARGAVVVSTAGKLKTSVQLAALVALCAARTRAAPATLADAGAALLALAAFLTLWSLAQYFAALWPYMAGRRSCR